MGWVKPNLGENGLVWVFGRFFRLEVIEMSFRGRLKSNNRIYESVIMNRDEFFIRIYGFYDI